MRRNTHRRHQAMSIHTMPDRPHASDERSTVSIASTDDNKVQECNTDGVNADEAKRTDFGIGWFEALRERDPEMFQLFPYIWRLLANGKPVTLNQLADAVSWPVQKVETTLHRQPDVEWNEQGRLIGYGMTLRPTPHKFTFDGQTVYMYCPSDAGEFPVVLGRSGTIESTCPATGQPIRVEVSPTRVKKVEPSSAVVALVRPDPDTIENLRAEVCNVGSYFVSREAAAEWLAMNPQGMVISVEEDFQLHRGIMEEIGWASPSPQDS